MLRKGFTLMELLVVIAIIAILAALLFPVFISVKGAVNQMAVGTSLRQTSMGTDLYLADHDDNYPLAMYFDGGLIRAWYGVMTDDAGNYDREGGILTAYLKSEFKPDKALIADKYLGDHNGLGYNWGVIGSDFHMTGDYSLFPNCKMAAHNSTLEHPSSTYVFATTSYYFATWLPDGDGKRYLFGFFDPASMWNGNPNMDFRHQGTTTVDDANQEVIMSGRAVVARADGSVRTYRIEEIQESSFWRFGHEESLD